MSPADQEKYNARVKALEEAYAPQVQGLQQQIATLPQQFEAQKSALQQAKENAFRDITKTASRGGMFFTGFTPREEARYLGEKYLPGLQQLSAQELSARQGLMGQIAGLQSQQRLAGLSYLDQLEALRRAEEEAARNRAAAASAGFGGLDLGFGGGGDTTGGGETPATPKVSAEEQFKINTANNTVQMFEEAKALNNYTMLANTIKSINAQLAKPNLSAAAKTRLNLQLEAIKLEAASRGVNLNKLAPSRYQAAQTIYQQRVLPNTPVGLAVRAVEGPGKSLFNAIFGRR